MTTSTQGGHGTTTCTAGGDCSYTPDAGFFGSDSFGYTISDGHGHSASATVHVTVNQLVFTIHLDPAEAESPIGTSHTLTATVKEDGTAVAGTTVTFEVLSGPNVGTKGSGETDAKGQATFSYVGDEIGTDTITATFVDRLGHTDTSNEATTSWIEVSATCMDKAVTIFGTPGDDVIRGTNGPDVIDGNGGADFLRGLGGDDVICGGDGNDNLRGNRGNDVIAGEAGEDVLDGDEGNDVLHGGDGNDKLQGTTGDDMLFGDAGDDRLQSASGDDLLDGGPGADFMRAGPDPGDTCVTGPADGDKLRGCDTVLTSVAMRPLPTGVPPSRMASRRSGDRRP